MKKKMLFAFLAFLVVGLGFLVWQGVENDKADTKYDKVLTVPAQAINTLHLSGLEQPVKVIVTETEQEETTVHVSGLLAQSNIKALEEQFEIDHEGDLVISFTKEGLTMTVMTEKPTLTIEINLAKGASFNDFYLFSNNGGAEVSLPASFDGVYKLKSKSGDINQPQDGRNNKRQVSVEVTGDIKVELEK